MAVSQKIHGMDHDKDLQKLLSQQQKENTRRYLRLQGKPFWIWSIEEHKHEDVGLMEIAALIISSVTI
jgi:hypothetical protein